MRKLREPKNIHVNIRIDETTQRALEYLESRPGWNSISSFVRQSIIDASIKKHEYDLQAERAIARLNEPPAQPVHVPRQNTVERYYAEDSRLKHIIAGEPVASRLPLRRLPTTTEDNESDPS